jgi:cephalosporin-C deacetylase-like acetyl esterase
MKKCFLFILFFCIASFTFLIEAQQKDGGKNSSVDLVPDKENLDVFQQWVRWNNPGSLLIHYLTKQAMDLYKLRDNDIEKLVTKSEWMKRQTEVKQKLMETVGPFPERTPLNARITGTIKKNGYRIEKVVYESMPGFFVTGCLYIPDGIKGKVPAILNVIGHNQEAFRAPLYQVLNYNLVKKRMIVFAIDPPGQGEHVQYYDPDLNSSSIGYSVMEHIYFGSQCFLSGVSCARYFIWDGIRGIDYLISRKEVDPDRIGVTGFSGGGTVTSYISAFDDRVKVSVPCSWATANRMQLYIKGIQDSESDFINGIVNGITFEDLIEVRAPKPTLMTFVSRDEYLTIQGPLEAYDEAQGAYQAFGSEDNLEISEDDSKHWMTPKIRLAIYSFFMKHFNIPGDPAELEAEIQPEEELKVTLTGQIATSFGGDMIFDVNRRETEKLINDLERSRKDIKKHLELIPSKAKEISGYIAPPGSTGEAFLNGRYQRKGYSVAKYAVPGEGEYVIPFLLFIPDNTETRHPAIVYLHPQGKVTDAERGGKIEKLVMNGYVVAAADVSGVGELKNTVANGQGKADAGYTALEIGRSVVGIQAGDIVRIINYLKERSEVDPDNIGGVAIDEMSIPLLHAAAFEPSVAGIVLFGPLSSYRSVAMNRIYKIGLTPTGQVSHNLPYTMDFLWGIAGVLKSYDLPDLIGSIAPRKIALVNIKDQTLGPASMETINEDMDFPRSVYLTKGVPENLKIISSAELSGDIIDWCLNRY